jgi:hypothetical protein
MRVRPDRELGCVAITLATEDAEYELALSIHSAIDAMLALVGAVDRLTRGRDQ